MKTLLLGVHLNDLSAHLHDYKIPQNLQVALFSQFISFCLWVAVTKRDSVVWSCMTCLSSNTFRTANSAWFTKCDPPNATRNVAYGQENISILAKGIRLKRPNYCVG